MDVIALHVELLHSGAPRSGRPDTRWIHYTCVSILARSPLGEAIRTPAAYARGMPYDATESTRVIRSDADPGTVIGCLDAAELRSIQARSLDDGLLSDAWGMLTLIGDEPERVGDQFGQLTEFVDARAIFWIEP